VVPQQQPHPNSQLQYQQGRQQRDSLPQQDQSRLNGGSPQPLHGAQDVSQYVRQLEDAIQQKRLQSFYPPGDPRIQQTAIRAAQQIDKLVTAWQIPREIAVDIVR
jgi:hypothetical protein